VELLSVIKARSIGLFDINELNPRGKSIAPEFLDWLKDSYGFSKVPSSINDLDATKALAFLGGSFQVSTENSIDVELRIYTDGFVADTRSSTKDSNAFLDAVLKSAAKRFKLSYKPEIIRKRMYLSELNLKSDRASLSDQSAKLKAFADKLASVFSGQVQLSGIGFWTDHTTPTGFSVFRFERKINTAFSEHRYYSVASLQTDDHMKLLDELEDALTKK
jgi:hypothetical protein